MGFSLKRSAGDERGQEMAAHQPGPDRRCNENRNQDGEQQIHQRQRPAKG
jgi:hypothetical protein